MDAMDDFDVEIQQWSEKNQKDYARLLRASCEGPLTEAQGKELRRLIVGLGFNVEKDPLPDQVSRNFHFHRRVMKDYIETEREIVTAADETQATERIERLQRDVDELRPSYDEIAAKFKSATDALSQAKTDIERRRVRSVSAKRTLWNMSHEWQTLFEPIAGPPPVNERRQANEPIGVVMSPTDGERFHEAIDMGQM